MRSAFVVVFAVLITALMICHWIAMHSRRAIGKPVGLLLIALVPPVLGNLIIIGSWHESLSVIGCYVYFLGMDMVMYALMDFTAAYCKGAGSERKIPRFFHAALILDAVQLLLNPFFGHAFRTERLIVEGKAYYRLVPLAGQFFHRFVDYGILAAVLIMFLWMAFRAPKVYRERYTFIILIMICAGIWQTFYVFSRTPIDRSMIGFGVFGLLIFYFSLYYRPLRLLDRMLSQMAAGLPEALYVFDPNGVCIWANEKGCDLVGAEPDMLEHAGEKLLALFGDPGNASDTRLVERKAVIDGETRYFTLEEHQVEEGRRRLTGSYLEIRDITEEKQRVKRELYDATHDRLTGLYTRDYLYQQISELRAEHPQTMYYILFIDVRNFKVVNDIFGSDFGDFALQCIADTLRVRFTGNGRFGRLAGDTFGACVPQEEFRPEKAEELLNNFTVRNEKAEYHVLIHVGVYPVMQEDTDVSVMFDRAHLSLSTIKDAYNTHIAFYDNEIRQKLLWNQGISGQLQNAIIKRQLCPYLQPIADTSGRIVGAEALVRWIHPEHGFMAPYKFIPVFEENGMIVEVDRYMWRCACEILQRWAKEGRDLFLSVNISPKDFYFVDVVETITALADEYGIDRAKLRVEITETVMMNDGENRMHILDEFRALGFIVEMDDFGSGYSSLNMLKDMPVDVLKIDMKFLEKTEDTKKAQIIVKNILNLTKELGIIALTEGVETRKQYHILAEMGCKLFQGYYFAKPMPAEEFDQFVDKTNG